MFYETCRLCPIISSRRSKSLAVSVNCLGIVEMIHHVHLVCDVKKIDKSISLSTSDLEFWARSRTWRLFFNASGISFKPTSHYLRLSEGQVSQCLMFLPQAETWVAAWWIPACGMSKWGKLDSQAPSRSNYCGLVMNFPSLNLERACLRSPHGMSTTSSRSFVINSLKIKFLSYIMKVSLRYVDLCPKVNGLSITLRMATLHLRKLT